MAEWDFKKKCVCVAIEFGNKHQSNSDMSNIHRNFVRWNEHFHAMPIFTVIHTQTHTRFSFYSSAFDPIKIFTFSMRSQSVQRNRSFFDMKQEKKHTDLDFK